MKRLLGILLITLCLSSCVLTTVPNSTNVLPSADRGIVSIRTPWGAGSGFVVAENRNYYYVATAAHVVANDSGENIDVAMVNGVWGDVVAFGNPDTTDDWAVIRVEKHNRRYRVYQIATTKQEARVRVAGFVYANGMDYPEFVVYHGRVVTLNWDGFICYNGGVYPGCSGGPMFDQWGRVVGITSRCTCAWGCPLDSSSLFVPATKLIEVLEELGL